MKSQQKPGNQVQMPSKNPGILPLFPFGLPQPTRLVTRRPTPSIKSPSQRRRDYVRAVLHRARTSALVKPVLPGTLRALALAAQCQPAASPSHPVKQPTLPLLAPSSPLKSTPSHPPKRKRTHSSPPTI